MEAKIKKLIAEYKTKIDACELELVGLRDVIIQGKNSNVDVSYEQKQLRFIKTRRDSNVYFKSDLESLLD